jgi:hypothetical protein
MGAGRACIQPGVLCLHQNFCYLGHSPCESLPIIREKCAMYKIWSRPITVASLKRRVIEVPELRC